MSFFLRRPFFFIITALVFFGAAYHLWTERYFLRFIPLPLALADSINTHSLFLPSYQDGVLNGQIDLPRHDLKTLPGLRATLNAIRDFSPLGRTNATFNDKEITFDNWLQEIKVKSLLCTDATQLFIAAAWAQGLKAREWHLVPPGWPSGQGHSVAEFFNPATGTWQLIDAQQASIIKDRKSGEVLNMLEVLRRYQSGQSTTIHIDYGPYTDYFTKLDDPGPTANYFFKAGLLSTPILQLRQPTWYASYARSFLTSGHFVIGYPIVFDGWSHHAEVLWTKLSFLVFIGSGALLLIGGFVSWRRKYIGN